MLESSTSDGGTAAPVRARGAEAGRGDGERVETAAERVALSGPPVPYPEASPFVAAAFFGRVEAWVGAAIATAFPRTSPVPALGEVAARSGEAWSAAEQAALRATIVEPIWTLVARTGKCWRPYLAALACEAVGGDARILWPDVIAVLELVQVGSLIVDDVEDGSVTRRNGPACHLVHGVARAVNAGTFTYLLAPRAIAALPLPAVEVHALVAAYLEMLTDAHVGQGLDIEGVGDALPDAVATGDTAALEARLRTIHRLKTARFVGFMARLGAVAGRGTELQVAALERYGVAIGCAFQALDDVSNLRGFHSDRRAVAEDLTHGKLTLPVARALGRLPVAQRRWIADLLGAHESDRARLVTAVELLESTGALDACAREARDGVEAASAALARELPASAASATLAEFGRELLRDRR